MTIGDVLAMIAGVSALCFSVWSLLMGGTLLFPARAETARTRLENTPLHALGTGVLMVAVGGAGGLVLINQPNGLLKLFGWVLLLGLLTMGALGGTGFVLLAGERARQFDAELSTFTACRRGAALIVVAALTPLVGWFLVAPLLIISSLGAGLYSFLRRKESIAISDNPAPTKTVAPLEVTKPDEPAEIANPESSVSSLEATF